MTGACPRRRYQRANVRSITIEGDLAYVPLTKGYTAIIDICDVPLA